VELADALEIDLNALTEVFAYAADPDAALVRICELSSHHDALLREFDAECWRRIALLFGASPGLGAFFVRHPRNLNRILQRGGRLVSGATAREELLRAVGADPNERSPIANEEGAQGAAALRARYRELLAETMLYDLREGLQAEAPRTFEAVSFALSGLAEAALEAALALARATVAHGHTDDRSTALL